MIGQSAPHARSGDHVAEPERSHTAQWCLRLGRERYRAAVRDRFDVHEGQVFERAEPKVC